MSSWPAVPCLVVLSLIVTPALNSLPSTLLAAAPASVSFLALPPLLSPCSCLLLLLLLLGLPSLPLLFSSSAPPLRALESYCWEKNAKGCGYQRDYIRGLWGSVSQNLISDLVRTSFAPRSDLVKSAASQSPARIVLERLCNGLSDEWAVCHGEVDKRICWHEVEFTVETIVMQHRSPPNSHVGSTRKFGVPFGKWWFYRHMVVNLSLPDTYETHSK